MEVVLPEEMAQMEGQQAAVAVQQLVTRRMLVNVDGVEIPDPKRNRAEPNNVEKHNSLFLIIHWHEYLRKAFGDVQIRNIDEIADLTSILWTMFTKLRQETNGVGGVHDRVNDEFEFTANGIVRRWGELKAAIKALGAIYGFNFGPSDGDRAKTGTLGSLLSLIDSFRRRSQEVRLGTTHIVLKKQNGTTKMVPITAFGLSQQHSILTTGSTYNPRIQSSMKMSLGPMTIAINLAMQTERVFQEAWKKAFVQTFKLIQCAPDIANLLAGSKADHTTMIGQLADIALFGVTRTSNKASFPAAFFLNVMRDNPRYMRLFNAEVLPNVPITENEATASVLGIDMSGQGAYNFWQHASNFAYFIRGNEIMTQRTASEMVFHSTWGTAKEDLSLLQWMTGQAFQTRRDIGEQLKERNGRVELQLIRFQKVCKLASASQTSFLSGGKGQVSRASGRCIRRVDLDDDLLLSEDKYEFVERHNNRARIVAKLNAIKEAIDTRVQRENGITFGTTGFFEYVPGQGYGQQIQEVPQLRKRYLYGQEE